MKWDNSTCEVFWAKEFCSLPGHVCGTCVHEASLQATQEQK